MRRLYHNLIIAILLSGALLLGPALTLAGSSPVDGEPMLVIAPPWQPPNEVIARAGGHPVGPVSAPLASLAVAGTAEPGFAQRLRRAGAWSVIDGTSLAALCGVRS